MLFYFHGKVYQNSIPNMFFLSADTRSCTTDLKQFIASEVVFTVYRILRQGQPVSLA